MHIDTRQGKIMVYHLAYMSINTRHGQIMVTQLHEEPHTAWVKHGNSPTRASTHDMVKS